MLNVAIRDLRVQSTERRAVAQHDPARGWKFDRGGLFQLSQRARHGFDGQTEIVGNVLAGHWKLDGSAACGTLRHFEQKASDPLLSALDQDHDVVLNALQFARGQCPHLLGDVIVTRGEGDHGTRRSDRAAALSGCRWRAQPPPISPMIARA